MGEFDKYRREVADRPREVIRETKPNSEDQQLKMMETLLNHLKEEAANQNRASVDLISSMVAKLDEKNERERERKREREEREREMEEQNSRRKISIKSEADENANRLLQELFHLRNEVSTLKIKEDPNRSAPIIDMAASMADYQSRIRKLEEVPYVITVGNRRWQHQQGATDEGVRKHEEHLRVCQGRTRQSQL